MNQTDKAAVSVITVDGPAASGKGTIAERAAAALGFHYLDSGALYRIATLAALKKGVPLTDAAALARIASELAPVFKDGRIYLEGEDVTLAIRAESVSAATSRVAAVPEVRRALFALQRRAARAPGLVADGRDMGTVVFPEAALKIFLTASPEVRAQRRYKQLIERGEKADLEKLVADLTERDRRDSSRAAAPLKPAPDAKLLDTSNMGIEEAVKKVLNWWDEKKKLS
jgi:CMP/dCMP kinase